MYSAISAQTGNTTGPHLHRAVWKQNPEKPGTWKAVDVYSNKLIKSRNIVYLDNIIKYVPYTYSKATKWNQV